MAGKGRPKLDTLEKALRKGKRLRIKLDEIQHKYDADPSGPTIPSRPGRPPVPYAEQLKRAKREYAKQKSEIKKIAIERGDTIKSVEARIDATCDPTLDRGVGRPKALEIQEIEYEIRLKLARIERIRLGEETKRLAQKKTKGGKHLGRYPKSDASKIRNLENKIFEMRGEIRAMEAMLTPSEKEDLAIRRLRHAAMTMRRKLREQGLDELRLEAHKIWDTPKVDLGRFPEEVKEVVALERSIADRAENLKRSGYRIARQSG